MRLTRAEARERNRQSLIRATRRLVPEHGAEVSLERIAEEAGVTTGAIYSIFGSRSDLLLAVVMEEVPRGLVGSLPASVDEDLAESVRAVTSAWLQAQAAVGARGLVLELRVLLMSVDDPQLGEKVAAAADREQELLAERLTGRRHVIDGAIRTTTPGQAATLARALRALFAGFGMQALLGNEAASAEEVHEAAEALTFVVKDSSRTAVLDD